MKEFFKKSGKKVWIWLLLLGIIIYGCSTIEIHRNKKFSTREKIINPVSCTIEIRCDSILDNEDMLSNPGLKKYIPKDGVILPSTEVIVEKGQSVYDVLTFITEEKDIQMESQLSAGFGTQYVQGINHIYEKNVGKYSGWLYSVNGQMPNYGCSDYIVRKNDTILWEYTCGDELKFD